MIDCRSPSELHSFVRLGEVPAGTESLGSHRGSEWGGWRGGGGGRPMCNATLSSPDMILHYDNQR